MKYGSKTIAFLMAMVLLLLVVAPVNALEDDPDQAVWYRWFANEVEPTTFEGTFTWTSGTSSGYMEYEVLYSDGCTECVPHLVEVGSKLVGHNDELFVYIATFDWDKDVGWINFQWRWSATYPASYQFDTLWTKTEKLSDDHVMVEIYDCTKELMLVTIDWHTPAPSSGILFVDNAMEYVDPPDDAHGTMAMQKIGNDYWGEHDWDHHHWVSGFKPYGRMHAYIECSGGTGCPGPVARGWLARLFGKNPTYSTDGYTSPVGPGLKKAPPALVDSRTSTESVPSTTFTSPYFVYMPTVNRCTGSKQWFFHLWWSD